MGQPDAMQPALKAVIIQRKPWSKIQLHRGQPIAERFRQRIGGYSEVSISDNYAENSKDREKHDGSKKCYQFDWIHDGAIDWL